MSSINRLLPGTMLLCLITFTGPGAAAQATNPADDTGTTPANGVVSDDDTREQRCIRYGETAVREQMDNLRDECGLSGGPWHTDFANHFNWCLSAEEEARDQEAQSREAALADCTPADNGNDRCHAYARRGVLQQQENTRFECEFSGKPWHGSYEGHLNWCRSVTEKRSDDEAAMRADLLSSCR